MIPIELPEWVRYAAIVFLALMVVEISVRVWQTIRNNKLNKRLTVIEEHNAEILSKVGLMFLMLKAKGPRSAETTNEFEKVLSD